MKRFIPVVFALLLAACASKPQEAALKVTDERDAATGHEVVYSPVNVTFASEKSPVRVIWQLRSEIVNADKVLHSLRINFTYLSAQPMRYASVRDAEHHALAAKVTGSGRTCAQATCPLSDTLDVRLDEATLTAHEAAGLTVVVATKSHGSITLSVPGTFLKLQVEAADKAADTAAP